MHLNGAAQVLECSKLTQICWIGMSSGVSTPTCARCVGSSSRKSARWKSGFPTTISSRRSNPKPKRKQPPSTAVLRCGWRCLCLASKLLSCGGQPSHAGDGTYISTYFQSTSGAPWTHIYSCRTWRGMRGPMAPFSTWKSPIPGAPDALASARVEVSSKSCSEIEAGSRTNASRGKRSPSGSSDSVPHTTDSPFQR